MEENTISLLSIAEILGNLRPATILVIHIEEIFGPALLVDWLHGERRLVIGGGECIGEPAIVLHGPLRLPKIENGLETFHLRGREPAPKQLAIVRSPPPRPREATTRRVGGIKYMLNVYNARTLIRGAREVNSC